MLFRPRRMLGKAAAEKQTFLVLAEGGRARAALTAGWWRSARWPRWRRSRGSCRGYRGCRCRRGAPSSGRPTCSGSWGRLKALSSASWPPPGSGTRRSRWAPPGRTNRQHRLPAAELGPPGRAQGAAAALGLGCGVPAAGSSQQPAPTRVRGGAPRRGGAARWGGSARMAPRPRTRGTHGIPLRASGRGGHRSAPRRRGLMKGRSKRVGGKKGSRFLGNVATERSCLLTGSIHWTSIKSYFSNDLKTLKGRTFTNSEISCFSLFKLDGKENLSTLKITCANPCKYVYKGLS